MDLIMKSNSSMIVIISEIYSTLFVSFIKFKPFVGYCISNNLDLKSSIIKILLNPLSTLKLLSKLESSS